MALLHLRLPKKVSDADLGTQRPPKEKAATDALMKRIHHLQNTRIKEL
jgi:hypothetical protein